jgi:hypothetical protein
VGNNRRRGKEPLAELSERLRAPVDGASLAVVRIGLGVLIAVEALNYLTSDWIARSFVDPSFHFTYEWFGWVQPWPGVGIYMHFAALAALGLLLALGVAHRIVAPLLAVGFAYVFLLDKAEYLNHFYAALLLLALIAVTPADRALSVAAYRRPDRPQVAPVWAVWILRFQVGVIYVYAGIAKLGDDWLAGEPMATWLAQRSDLPLVGPLLEMDPAGVAFSWGGAIYDLAIVPLLLWRRTRGLAMALVVAFNLTNWIIFDIGIFPPMMIVATTIFLDPDWPRRLLLRLGAGARSAASRATTLAPAPAAGSARLLVPLLALYVAVQLLVPLRHHLYPGLVHWTEEGHRFAWQMKLRQKDGSATFYAVDPRTGERRELRVDDLVTARQLARASTRPDMLLQLAHRLDERESARGEDVEIRVSAPTSLNGRPGQPLVDERRDLAAVPVGGLGAADWIAPEPPD